MFHRGHEHSARMAHLVDELNLPDFAFFAWDARDHGLSKLESATGTLPSLDLVSESSDILKEAIAFLEANSNGQTLVSCALGVSRSAAVAATWLVASGHAPDTTTAIAILRKTRPRIVLKPEQIAAIEDA